MNISEYAFLDPEATPAGRALALMARRPGGRANRLVAALEAFALENTVYADRVTPPRGAPRGMVEVFCVPPRSLLADMPDAAALVRVDHARRTVELMEVIEHYGGPDIEALDAAIIDSAGRAVAGR